MTATTLPGTWWLRAAALILAANGLIVLVYAPIMGPTAILWALLGLGRLAAAVGVVGRHGWARSLGVLFAVVGAAIDAGGLLGVPVPADSLARVIAAISLVTWLVVLFALLRRWPGPAAP